jgi:hypothetical protein
MTDRELLELAALAAGNGAVWYQGLGLCIDEGGERMRRWRPLEDKGDALDLALKLRMSIVITTLGPSARAEDCIKWEDENIAAGEDCGAALCRAIVRAAAKMAPATFDQRTVDIPL